MISVIFLYNANCSNLKLSLNYVSIINNIKTFENKQLLIMNLKYVLNVHSHIQIITNITEFVQEHLMILDTHNASLRKNRNILYRIVTVDNIGFLYRLKL